MVALSKAWTFQLNNLFSDQTDQLVQYQEQWFAFVEAHRLAGWTVTHSSDGVTAGAGDRILSPANVVIGGSFAGNERSWVVMTPPAAFYGKGGASIAGELMSQLFVAFDNSYNPGSVNPRFIAHTWNSGGSYTGGSITANPTPSGGVTSDMGSSDWRNTWLIWTSPTPAQISYWYSEDGEVCFFNKRLNVPSAESVYMARTFRDSAEGAGDYRYVFYAAASTSAGLQANGLESSSNWIGRNYSGTALFSIRSYSLAWRCSQWSLGTEYMRSAAFSSVRVASNAGGASGRDYGILTDFWACPANQIQNRVFSGDTDVVRQYALGATSGGSVWLPAPRASLPIL